MKDKHQNCTINKSTYLIPSICNYFGNDKYLETGQNENKTLTNIIMSARNYIAKDGRICQNDNAGAGVKILVDSNKMPYKVAIVPDLNPSNK